MLVNANIKSKKELAQRLIDGETLYFQSSTGSNYIKLLFDESYSVPFRADEFELDLEWEAVGRIFIEQNWWDNIPKEGVLCWVDDMDRESRTCAVRIISLGDDKYTSVSGLTWNYATPVKPEECLQL